MRTELRLVDHLERPGEHTIEVWYDGAFVAGIYGLGDRPGVRIISKYLRNRADTIVLVVDDPPVLEVTLAP